MAAIAAILFTVLFAILAARTGALESARAAMASSAGVMAVMRDPALDDDAKERQMRKLSLHLMGLFGQIVLRVALAFAAPLLGLLLLDHFGVVSLPAVEQASLSWPLLIFYAAMIAAVPLLKRRPA